ncbi:polysaccharide biosynthesis tyrosine autokinase [Herbiconiux sp. CPCC 205716]|uniref:Polysaccharide biosynthesis tyrosine autokinase n=1 Tax=Herbiconiux gentiana TaxID=2970912 RepID=A0ABT2GDN1_9MICO|nr:polysaccharide biosynthesis tyrosine autokinase [Herbiconiux gentiana]MCS5713732.1 polysaccharide biosynthesis tyrosine autokinase [Herbiconiux gentiana]
MELRSYAAILRAHWLAIVALLLLGGAVAFGWSLLQPKVYQADASGYISAGAAGDTGSALVGDNLAKSKVKSYIDIGTSRAVAQHAIDELGLVATPESLVQRIKVSNPDDTVLLEVTALAGTPTDARDLAEAWLRGIQEQIDSIETQSGASADGSTDSIVKLIPLDSATLPDSPLSPNTRLAIVIGLVVGLVLGIALAFVRHAFDRRIRGADAVESQFGISVVGSIPVDRRFTDQDRLVAMEGATDYSRVDDDDVAVAESLRELRTNLQFMNVDDPPRVIVVTSPLPGDGKSTTIANLAIALAAGGQNVILVDADLRRPTVSTTFNLVGGAGLTEVLAGRSEVTDVLQPWGTSGRLFILAAGKTPPNPSELLGSERMHSLLAELSQFAIVLIDAPPLIPVTDAAILTHNTDGALVVASVGKTTYEALAKALANLERANGKALGVILNRVPRKGGGYYGYQYRGDYTAVSRADSVDPATEALPGLSGTPTAMAAPPRSETSSRQPGSEPPPPTFDDLLAEPDANESEVRTAPGEIPARSRRELRSARSHRGV